MDGLEVPFQQIKSSKRTIAIPPSRAAMNRARVAGSIWIMLIHMARQIFGKMETPSASWDGTSVGMTVRLNVPTK